MSIEDNSAILDLSYRNYDGPIGSATRRWAVIARTMVQKALRMKSFWVLTVFAGWYFIAMIIILFFMQQIGANNVQLKQGLDTAINAIVWKDQFFHGFGYSQHILLIVTLIVGAGSIANDNRANALLVYLSKPTRKIDYLVGKWIGVFVPIFLVMVVPVTMFYLYGLFTFRDQGFFSGDHFLYPKLVFALLLAGAIHTSLILFISSLFKQGAVAGAVYAGVYFMGYFFSLLMIAIFRSDADLPAWTVKLNFVSIDGFITGFARTVVRPGGSMPFGLMTKNPHPLPNPTMWPYLLLILVLLAVFNALTWSRIKAVEIV